MVFGRGRACIAGVSLVAFLALGANAALAGSACYRKVVSPPVYGTVSEQVLVAPEQAYTRVIPAEVQTVAEQVMLSPGHRVWQHRYVNGEETLCLIDVPPTYGTRYRQVVVREAQVVREFNPAQYRTVSRNVLVSPASASWQPMENDCPYGY